MATDNGTSHTTSIARSLDRSNCPQAGGRRGPRGRRRAALRLERAGGRHHARDVDRISRCAPFYQAGANAYTKVHPEVKITVFSTSLREIEQKLSAAVPTGTGPDIFDIGTNISVNFIDSGLLDPNPPDVDTYLKSGAWNKFVVDFFTINGKTYGLPLWEGSKASMYYNKTMFKEAGIAGPPATIAELVAAAQKLVKFDASRQDDPQRHQPAPLRPGQRHLREVPLRARGRRRLGDRQDARAASSTTASTTRRAGRRCSSSSTPCRSGKIDDPKVQHDADAFVAGNTAMLFREAWVIGEIQEKNPELDYGVAPIPRWKAGPHRMLLQPWGIYVNGKSATRRRPGNS